MSDASRLVRAMQRAAKPKENEIVDIVTGTVTSINPLKIKTNKLELTESFLILGALCVETVIPASHIHNIPQHTTDSASVGDYGSHNHSLNSLNTEEGLPTVKLWRGLQVGDDVYMIRYSAGQKYYVLQRKEGIK